MQSDYIILTVSAFIATICGLFVFFKINLNSNLKTNEGKLEEAKAFITGGGQAGFAGFSALVAILVLYLKYPEEIPYVLYVSFLSILLIFLGGAFQRKGLLDADRIYQKIADEKKNAPANS